MKQKERYKILGEAILGKVSDVFESHFMAETVIPVMAPTIIIGIPFAVGMHNIYSLHTALCFFWGLLGMMFTICILAEYA